MSHLPYNDPVVSVCVSCVCCPQSATLSSFSHFLKAFQSGARPPPLLIMVPQLQALFKEDRNNERCVGTASQSRV